MSDPETTRILYMEDDPGIARLVQRALKRAGYCVDLARDGQEGMDMHAARPYDVLLVDQAMPVYEGLEVIQRLFAAGSLPPTIMITGSGNEQLAVQAIKLGASDYVVKDMAGGFIDLLPSVIGQACQQKRLAEERARALEALRKERDFSTTVLNTVQALVVVLDPQGGIVSFNRACEHCCGYNPEEVQGQPIWDVLFLPEDREHIQAVFAELGKSHLPTRAENYWLTKTGHKRLIEWSNSVLKDTDGSVEYIIGTGIDITERKRAEQQLQSALEEKDILLKEIHHRVKNNLQALIYLIDMQAETVQDPQILSTLGDLQGRARTMALVHEKLYQSHDLARVDFKDYLQDLAAQLHYTLAPDQHVAMHIEAENLEIDVNTAIPCGMIVNELVTNALKHAFPRGWEGEREIRVSFAAQRNEYVLTVSDNGSGIPQEVDWRSSESLGLKLVNIWATYQLRGSIELDRVDGTSFTIRFPSAG